MSDICFESCIKCMVCIIVCLVSCVNSGYSGFKQVGLDGECLCLKDGVLYDEVLKYCINCKWCEVVCLLDVKIGDIIQCVCVKYDMMCLLLCNFIFSYIDLMGSVLMLFVLVVNIVIVLKLVCQLFDYVFKIDYCCILLKYFFGIFCCWYCSVVVQQVKYKDQVVFFYGCFVNYNYLQFGKDLIKVLNVMGIGVQLLSKEKCCGVLLIVNGFMDKVCKQVISNVELLCEVIVVKGILVIVMLFICMFVLCDEYFEVLDVDNVGLCEYIELVICWLWCKLDVGKMLLFNFLLLKVVYYMLCYMEKMGWMFYMFELLW